MHRFNFCLNVIFLIKHIKEDYEVLILKIELLDIFWFQFELENLADIEVSFSRPDREDYAYKIYIKTYICNVWFF